MDHAMFQHLFGLIERTGDRLIVVDPTTRRPYVILGLSQYEALVEQPQTPKRSASFMPNPADLVNEDIAAWRATQEPEIRMPEAAVVPSMGMRSMGGVAGFVPEPLESAVQDDDRFYVEPIE
ncbi:MAG: hypothetical protein Q7T01_02735 [bacterium]|nr:hypothetical protein [bacterium]